MDRADDRDGNAAGEAMKASTPSLRQPSVAWLRAEYGRVSDRVVVAVKQQIPVGSTVHWERRGFRQRGEVIAHLGFQAHNLRLRVRNLHTNGVVDIHLGDIEEANRG